jgi:iron complex outermembrane receptor protein
MLMVAGSTALFVCAGEVFADVYLEEIKVTATRRAESLQDVPISLLAISGEDIEDMSISRMEELTASMPAVTVIQSPIGNQIFIRGVGTPGSNQGIEQSVSIFHDGVYMGRHQLSRAPFMDLERVEVLRGPQSILFGKNTIGGALSVITAKPTEEFESWVIGLYGSDKEYEVSGIASGSIKDSLRGRLSFRAYGMDGYLLNTMTGEDNPNREDFTVRGQLAWDFSEILTANFKYEYSKFKQTGTHTQLGIINPLTPAAAGTSALNAILAGGPEEYDELRAVYNDGGVGLRGINAIRFDGPGFPDKLEGSDNKMSLAQLNLDWALEGHTITSITAYAGYDYDDVCDCDFAALPLIQVEAQEDYDQFSQEFRLMSELGNTFDYIAGLYYQNSKLDYSSAEGFGTNLLAPVIANMTRDYSLTQDVTLWAIFGQLAWNFSDRTNATFGLRYSHEKKKADHPLTKRFTDGWTFAGTGEYGSTPAEYDRFEIENPALAAAHNGVWASALGTFEHDIQNRKRSEGHVSWSLGLDHHLNDNTLLYGTISTGYKGGGFDARYLKLTDGNTFEYEEEKATAYELGSKMTLLGGAMTLNLAAFLTDIDDYQVSIFDGATGFLVTNAARLRTRGVEAEISWAATEDLVVNAAVTYLVAKYKEFPNGPCTAAEEVEATEEEGPAPNSCRNPFDPESAGRDRSGYTNIYAPKWAGNLNFDYRRPFGGSFEFRGTLNFYFSDDFVTASDLDPLTTQDSFTKIDARLSLGSADGKWEVAAIGKNLSNEESFTQGNDQPLVPGNFYFQTNRLRSYAIQVL